MKAAHIERDQNGQLRVELRNLAKRGSTPYDRKLAVTRFVFTYSFHARPSSAADVARSLALARNFYNYATVDIHNRMMYICGGYNPIQFTMVTAAEEGYGVIHLQSVVKILRKYRDMEDARGRAQGRVTYTYGQGFVHFARRLGKVLDDALVRWAAIDLPQRRQIFNPDRQGNAGRSDDERGMNYVHAAGSITRYENYLLKNQTYIERSTTDADGRGKVRNPFSLFEDPFTSGVRDPRMVDGRRHPAPPEEHEPDDFAPVPPAVEEGFDGAMQRPGPLPVEYVNYPDVAPPAFAGMQKWGDAPARYRVGDRRPLPRRPRPLPVLTLDQRIIRARDDLDAAQRRLESIPPDERVDAIAERDRKERALRTLEHRRDMEREARMEREAADIDIFDVLDGQVDDNNDRWL